jgi:hypothetical protein
MFAQVDGDGVQLLLGAGDLAVWDVDDTGR